MKLNWKKIWNEFDKWYDKIPENYANIDAQPKIRKVIKRIVKKEFDDLECPKCGCEFRYYKNRGEK